MTGAASTGALAILDFVLSYFLITRLEERELEERFGREYAEYKRMVPKFFPVWG